MHKATRLLTVFIALLPVLGADRPTSREVSTETLIKFNSGPSGVGYGPLVSLMIANGVPVSVLMPIGNERSLCHTQTRFGLQDVRIGDLIKSLKRSWPEYDVFVASGVLHIWPKAIPDNVQKLLDAKVPATHIVSGTHGSASVQVWGELKQRLNPRLGSMYAITSSPDAEELTSLSIPGGRLRDELDYVAKQGAGAAWILFTSEVGLVSTSSTPPYRMFSYSGESQALLQQFQCSADQ